MDYTTIIGLEVHVQLDTRTKLFCGCSTEFRPDEPNTQTCPVCLGLPGALPVMNRRAFELGLQVGLALNCDISRFTKWDRKQYYYPDLPKAYQISQFDLPMAHDGYLDIVLDEQTDESKRIGIIRAHLEEDAGKNSHSEGGKGRDSRVDLNRCGTPLIEIVSAPDLRSAAEARRYMEEMRLLLTYLGVSNCNMQEGNLRCDVNLNLHITQSDGSIAKTPITEIKNLNSFRNVEIAAGYEAKRQLAQFKKDGRQIGDPGVTKATYGFDADAGTTFLQREKEESSDYRYFPDPDLLPVVVSEAQLTSAEAALCEPPSARRIRFREAYLLPSYDAAVIIAQERAFADSYETVAKMCGDGKLAANWMTQDVLRDMKERDVDIEQFPLSPEILGTLLTRIANKDITTKGAREVYAALLEEADALADGSASATDQDASGGPEMGAAPQLLPDRVDAIIEQRGLKAVSDESTLLPVIDQVIGRNEKIVEDVRSGNEKAVGPLIGQVMGQVKGANPGTVRQMILDRING